MRNLSLITLLFAALSGCNHASPKQTAIIGIYLMKSYRLFPRKCLVDQKSIVLQDTPFVNNDEILKYFLATHEFALTEGCQQKFRSLPPRTPVALVVNNEIIFSAINMPAYISSTCDNSIVTTFIDSTRKVRLNLGYPGFNHDSINDQRNNVKLVSALEEQGKLN